MIEQDTIKLLRECDAGVKMGVASINETMDYVKDGELKKNLSDCKEKHEELRSEIETSLAVTVTMAKSRILWQRECLG